MADDIWTGGAPPSHMDEPDYLRSLLDDSAARGEPVVVPIRPAITSRAAPLVITPAALPDPRTIPPREWLYGVYMLRRYLTVLVAPGGVGKTALTIAQGLALAAGKPLLGDYVHQRVNVLYCGLEDPAEELDRRIAAAMIHHRLDAEEIGGRVYAFNGRDRRLQMATLQQGTLEIVYPDKAELTKFLTDHEIGAVFVDPFVNSHDLDENSNPHINAAARAWAEVANEAGCAITLVHHTRKGAVAGDADSGRGASALVNAARVALTLSTMSEDDASRYGVSADQRRLHIRLDDPKANLAPPADKARWFRLVGVALGNGTPEYPAGDNVQTVEQWEPPSPWEGITMAQAVDILEAIERGPSPGEQYTSSRRGRSNGRWAGNVVLTETDRTDAQAAAIIKAWVTESVLIEGDYHSPEMRKSVAGLTVNEGKISEMRRTLSTGAENG